MDIQTYMSSQKKTLSEIAQSVDVKLPTFHGYTTGRRRIPLRIAVAVEKVTNGMVTPHDWLPATLETQP